MIVLVPTPNTAMFFQAEMQAMAVILSIDDMCFKAWRNISLEANNQR